jgi:hypothetical protein
MRTILSSILILVGFALLTPARARAQTGASGCYAHRPRYSEGSFEVKYDANCTGHDEPELDPVSTLAGSAQNFTWTAILPSSGATSSPTMGQPFGSAAPSPTPRACSANRSLSYSSIPTRSSNPAPRTAGSRSSLRLTPSPSAPRSSD